MAAEPNQPHRAAPEREGSRQLGALRDLLPFLRPYRRLVVAALVALVLTASVSLSLPLAVRGVVDTFENGEARLLDNYFALALGISAVLALGTAARFIIVSRLGERVVADIRMALFDRVIGMSPAFYERVITGEVVSRITTDTTLIQAVIGSSVSVALRNLLIFVGGLVMMMLTSYKLTGLALLIVPVVVIPILALGRRMRALSRETQDRIAASSGNAAEALYSVQTVQAYTHEAPSRREFAEITEASFSAACRRIWVRGQLTVIVIFLVFTGIVGVLWIGANDVRAGQMTVGELVQFLIYAVLVSGAIAALSEVWGELQRAAGATERLGELLQSVDTVQDPSAAFTLPTPVRGELSLEAVSFLYPARPDAPALDSLDLTIAPGETVAFVGPSGAGKSTIIQLLLRFYDPQKGRITLDGIDLRHLRKQDLRSRMALVPQEPVVFATTARENIRFGRLDATDDEIEAAAHAAAAHEFIAGLPEGYDTFLGEQGVMLSGGQRQRLAIARAILRDAPILLLDEATSALDAESEQAVQQAVEALSKGRTTLVVAHRLATVKRADRIVVLDEGRIVASGTHDTLVAGGGLYARLAALQFTDGIAAE